ncbi:beta strand repeat-containing protein, partial [Runella salmonicolor]
SYSGTGTFSVPAGGPYNYTVTDANGCTASASVASVSQPAQLNASASVTTPIDCFGGNAVITVSATGGTGSYGGTGTFSVPAGGPYNYTVTDANGCTASASVASVSQPAQLNASASVTTPIACFGGNAVITVSATGGTGSYSGTGTFSVPAGGPYNYTVTDANGCSASASVASVSQPAQLNASASNTKVTCVGGNDGTITVTASGGTGALTYSKNGINFQSSNTFSGLTVGPYTLTVKDDNGCTVTTQTTVTQQDLIPPTAVAKNITVQLNASGNVTITAAQVNDGSSDNCSFTLALNQTTFNCSNVGPNTVTLTATDPDGNSHSVNATVTVQDVTKPTVITKNIAVTLGMGGTVDITANDVDNGSSDACGIQTKSVSPSSFNAAGNYTVTLTVTDVNGNSDERTATVSVNRRATTLTYSGETSGQYSDPVVIQATLIDNLTNTPISGKNISFTLGAQSTSATTDGSGLANSSITLNQAPGNYTVASAFAGDGIYGASSDSDPFAINKENAVATYTGAMFASTANSTSSTATVTLAATIQDITAVIGNANYDANAGDIAKATFAFKIVEGNITIPATIGYVTPGDTKTGTATATFNANIGNASSESYTVQLLIDGYYTGQSFEVITVSKPLNDFITGGGYLILANSAGVKAGDNGTRNNFGFNVKYNKSGKNLQGNINTIVRRMEGGVMHYYQVKGNAMTSLAVQPTAAGGTATFNGKANIQDITDPLNVIAVDGNATLQVEMTDNGEPGSTDMIGITVWNKSGGLWFASNWNGVRTTQQILGGGNLKASGGTPNPLNARQAAEEVIPAEELALDVVIAPNPAANQVKVMLQGWGQTRNVRLRLTDFTATSLGEWNVEINNGSGSTTLDLSSQPLGSYLIIAEGDQKRLTKKILKAGN